jgi:trigger factor
MKVKRTETPDGKIELRITASPSKVQDAIRFVDFQLAMQNGINPQDPEKLNATVREEVGEAYYQSYLDFQALQFLAPFAVTQEKLSIIGPPKVASSGATVAPGKEISFTAVVIPKPVYEIEDFSPVKIQIPQIKIEEAEIDQQLVMIAENYATFEKDEDRPVKEGDNLSFTIKTVDAAGEEVKGLTADRRSYTLGQDFMPKEFDENLLGMDVGETKTFDVTSVNFKRSDFEDPEKTETFTFTVTILEIQKRVIPAITDEWVEKNIPGSSTVPELREEIREQGIAQRERELDNMKTFLAASEFAKRFKGSIPDELYELTRDDILRNIQQNVQAQGKTMQEFINEQAGGEQQFSMQLMLQTREVLTQGFSLDALARHLKLETTDEDIKETFRVMAPGHEREAQMEFEFTGRMYQIYEAALRSKANKWLVDNAEVEYVG